MSSFEFPQLDARTRELMLEEFFADCTGNRLYTGDRLNDEGRRLYTEALEGALAEGTPLSLQQVLEPVPGTLWHHEVRTGPLKTSTTARTSARTLAEGEYNRFYMRAMCRRATDSGGSGKVVVSQGKRGANRRLDRAVTVQVGDVLSAIAVLDDLREHPGRATATGVPNGPNSGLSISFVPE
ncbi:hypothetical protein ACNHUS_23795 [Actinomycetes bacterium M1A6_2h]